MSEYIIKKNGKRFGKKCFEQYEAARSYVRKLLRKNPEKKEWTDIGWSEYANPSISDHGFSVTRKG